MITIQNVENVNKVTIEIVEVDNTITIQPVIMVNGQSGDLSGYMKKSVYDPAGKEEQVLTINDVIDGGTIT